ncbi:hypothetical protein [Enterococcus hulanensis]|uniref:hypothetical protein n=1 Tax=Enterococcus hulanensis TaxID=2559929 RepID=UPI0010F759F0|nr:hypothetical protein [Enterococcus hulanensis]
MDYKYTFIGPSSSSTTKTGTVPANISKTPASNAFKVDIPAYNKSSTYPAGGSPGVEKVQSLYTVVGNLSLVPSGNMRHIKTLSTHLPLINYNRYNYLNGSYMSASAFTNSGNFIKQSDNSYLYNNSSNSFLSLGRREVSDGFYGSQYSHRYGDDNDTIEYRPTAFQQVKEIFEDTTGALITVPSGYTQNKLSDITSDPYVYTMSGGSTLPKTYVIGSNIYTYQGWYKGAGNQGSINPTFPPNVTFSAEFDDLKDEVHLVYDVKLVRTVTENYIDTSGAVIDPSWNGTQSVATGSTFTATPAVSKTSAGTEWLYQGWKLSTEPMSAVKTTPVSQTINANTTIQYIYRKNEHTLTEKIVDSSDGTTLLGVASNPASVNIDDNDTYTKIPVATLTDTSGDDWDYVGWENVTDASGVVNSSGTPVSIANVKGNKEIKYHYRLAKTTATLDLTPTPKIIANGGTVTWTSKLMNSGSTAMKDLKVQSTSIWASGLSNPVQVTYTPAIGIPQNFSGNLAAGINLTGVTIPSGGVNNYATISFTTTATGAVNQVLPAEIEIDGNLTAKIKADNFVRIDDPDEPNLNQTGDSVFENLPDFRFGTVNALAGSQTKKLDASAYAAGYNPYIRFKDQSLSGNWDVAVKLGQFSDGMNTLPTSTSISLNNGSFNTVNGYNTVSESLIPSGSVANKTLYSDGTSVVLHAGTTKGVYQINYNLNDVELSLPSTSGVSLGKPYNAILDWELSVGP